MHLNDCPKFGGGLYWPEYDDNSEIVDSDDGRDYKRGEDKNKTEQQRIIEDIISRVKSCGNLPEDQLKNVLNSSLIVDITEYGRMVHAEMESLLSMARNNVSSRDATIYCTTFPCHNCAKHIVASGILKVVYIEPYPKSRAAEFHSDSISLSLKKNDKVEYVKFEPFVGVGPRRFFDLFSMKLGSGHPMRRKNKDGTTLEWSPETAKLRIQMLPASYLDLELIAAKIFSDSKTSEGVK